MRISKKILAIALSILMAVSMMPFTVFADDLPTLTVTQITPENGEEVAYKYTANDDENTVQASPYKDYLVDFLVSFDKDVAAGDVQLSGSYQFYNNGEWVPITLPDLDAGVCYKLLGEGLKDAGYDYAFTYEDICTVVKEFKCAATGLNALGTEMTVWLALYADADDTNPIILDEGTIEYTFGNPPKVLVEEIDPENGEDVAYKYTALDDADSVQDSPYKDWLADFTISFDQDIEAGAVELSGSYQGYNNGEWVSFDLPALAAGQEYKLLHEGLAGLGYDTDFTYEDICTVVKEFKCALKNKNAWGSYVYVKLNLYEDANSEPLTIKSGYKYYEIPGIEMPGIDVERIVPENGEEVAYKYTALDDEDSVQLSYYKDYIADFTISFDQAIEAGDVQLSGSYQAYNNGEWVSFDLPALAAGQEYRLLHEGLAALGYDSDFTYEDICTVVKEFKCAATGIDANGVTATVKLNLYDPATGEAIELEDGTVQYTFGGLPGVKVEEIDPENGEDVAYKYTALDDENSVQNSPYKDYIADFTISFDQDIEAGDVQLSGAYQGYNDGEWVSFDLPALAEGQEYRLLHEGLAGLGYDSDFTYEDICTVVKEFKCAATGLNAAGVTATVKLNLYDPATGEAIEIPEGTVEYTFAIVEDSFDVWVEDTLDFNLYIQDDRADYVEFEYNGSPEQEANVRKTETVTKEEAEQYDNLYHLSIKLAPAQAYDDVTYTVYDENDEVLRSNTTSAAEYLNTIIEDPYYNDPEWDWGMQYVNLSKALYDYCKAAAEYFNYNAAAYTTPYYFSGMNATADTVDVFTERDTTGKALDMSYVATSEPAIRIVMDLTEEEAAALSVSCDDATASFAKRGDDVVLEIKDIPLSKLGDLYVVDIDGLGSILVTPYSYANRVAQGSDALARLGKSIYNVNKAAAAFFA